MARRAARGKIKHPIEPEEKIRSALSSAFVPAVRSIASAVASGDLHAAHAAHDKLSDHIDALSDHFESLAADTAESVQIQIARVLGIDPSDFDPDLSGEIDAFTGSLNDAASGATADLLDRAEELLDGDEISEESAEESLSGVVGTLLVRASMAFAWGFGQLNRSAQQSAGVEEYEWSSLHDDKVRPAHEALDGVRAHWDDPPLSASDSDNGEDDHAGDDFACRCVALPVTSIEDEGE